MLAPKVVDDIRWMRSRIEELEAEVAYWKDQACPSGTTPLFDLTQQQTKILVALARAGGSYLRPFQIIDAAYGSCNNPPMANTISVMIANIRKRLRPLGLSIVSRNWYGYALDAKTLRAVRDAMKENGHVNA